MFYIAYYVKPLQTSCSEPSPRHHSLAWLFKFKIFPIFMKYYFLQYDISYCFDITYLKYF